MLPRSLLRTMLLDVASVNRPAQSRMTSQWRVPSVTSWRV
jgi:hypothetical protein